MWTRVILTLATLAVCSRAESHELHADTFASEVLADERVWLVEFYSGMCGSCIEFAPVWESIEATIQTIKLGKVNIDVAENLRLAEKLGVLDEGVPNIQLFASKKKRDTIMSGDLVSKKDILNKVHKIVKDLKKSGNGFFMRSG